MGGSVMAHRAVAPSAIDVRRGSHKVERRRRNVRDACAKKRRSTLRHQPSPPRRFRGRHHAACIAWLSAGLRARGHDASELASPTRRRFPGPPPQCVRATSFPPTAAGQRRHQTGFPFHPWPCGPRNRRPQDIAVSHEVNRRCCVARDHGACRYTGPSADTESAWSTCTPSTCACSSARS